MGFVPNQIKRLFKQKAKKINLHSGEANQGRLHERQVCYHQTNYARLNPGIRPRTHEKAIKTKS